MNMYMDMVFALLLASTSTASAGRLLRGNSTLETADARTSPVMTSGTWQKDMKTWWVDHPPSSLAQHIWETQNNVATKVSHWEYTRHPCIQGKFQRLAQIMKDNKCGPTVGEIGGGLNPMDKYYSDASLYVDMEPAMNFSSSQSASGGRSMHLPMVIEEYNDHDDFRTEFGLPANFDCTVAIGMFTPQGPGGLIKLVSKTQTLIFEMCSWNNDYEARRRDMEALGLKQVHHEIYDCSTDKAFMEDKIPWRNGEFMNHEQKLKVGRRQIWVFQRKVAGESAH
jgi:hypothetical protein